MVRLLLPLVFTLIVLVIGGVESDARQTSPLDVARVLAARYPENPSMSYIPALAWSSSLQLAQLTREEKWKEKPRRDLEVFLSGGKPSIAAPYALTSLAGHLAFADLASHDGNQTAARLAQKAADFIMADASGDLVKFRRNWTDDMFMTASVLARVARQHDASQGSGSSQASARYADVLGQLLTSYAAKLQRPDGVFIHAIEGPHAWGRGNGFALLGLTEALTFLPATWAHRARVLEIYRKQVNGLLALQSDDGAWRQVVDERASYRELTVTAMTVTALARGVRLGWLDASVRPAIDRGWNAVAARVNADGTVKDVCASTGAQSTKDYYLNRPAVNGADDRGGAMALLAAVEVAQLTR
jgi:rhamnogalacturonyl hydrolase YesR